MDINLHVELERGQDGSSLRPADVLVHGLEGQPVAVDFAVAHTLQSNINLADVQPGQVARHTERRKTTERQALCLANGWTFTPFVMETIGSWGGKGRRLLQQVIDIWAVEHGRCRGVPNPNGACAGARTCTSNGKGLSPSRSVNGGFL